MRLLTSSRVCVCVYVAGYCRHMRASSISSNSSAYRPPASRQLAELHRAVFITCRCIRHATSAARSVARGPRRLPVLNLCCEISAHGLVSYCAAVCNVLSYRYVHYSGCQRLRHMVAPRACNTNYHVPTRTHTHTHSHLTALFLGPPGSAGTRKVKPVWILLKQETASGSGISWAVCMSAHRCRPVTTLALSFYRPDALPAAQPTASKH